MFKITTSFKRMALMMVLAISGTISVLAGNRLVLNDGGPIAIKPGETKEITVRGCVKTLLFLKNHKALTFTSQGFAMSKSCCNFRP